METSEREKLMGMFCRGNKENKKPATENRTGNIPPSKGAPRALWQPARALGPGVAREASSQRLEDTWACLPRTRDHQRSRVRQEELRSGDTRRCWHQHPSKMVLPTVSTRPPADNSGTPPTCPHQLLERDHILDTGKKSLGHTVVPPQ